MHNFKIATSRGRILHNEQQMTGTSDIMLYYLHNNKLFAPNSCEFEYKQKKPTCTRYNINCKEKYEQLTQELYK